MPKKNATIEINGKTFDANTGDLISGGGPKSHSNRPIDDVHARGSGPVNPRGGRSQPKSVHSHKPGPSKTLMRRALKKPGPSLKRQIKTASPVANPAGIVTSYAQPMQHYDEARLKHATQIKRSNLISHFPPSLNDVSTRPSKSQAQNIQPAPASLIVPPLSKPKTTADVLEHAIKHVEARAKTPRPANRGHSRRRAGISATVAIAVSLAGFVASQNMSNIKLQVASAKAGFDASLPSYRPAGYSLGKLNYSQGVVSADFSSNSDQRQYHVIQKLSQWDSEALRSNFVSNQDPRYSSQEVAGRTVYLYGKRNITWVSDGIWYIVQGSGSLNDQQLIDIAKSL